MFDENLQGPLYTCDLQKDRQRWGGSRAEIQPRPYFLEQLHPPGEEDAFV